MNNSSSTQYPSHGVWWCSTPKQPQAPVLPCFFYNPCRKWGSGAAKTSWEIQWPEETCLRQEFGCATTEKLKRVKLQSQAWEPGAVGDEWWGHQPLPREIHTRVKFCHRQGLLNAQVNQLLTIWG